MDQMTKRVIIAVLIALAVAGCSSKNRVIQGAGSSPDNASKVLRSVFIVNQSFMKNNSLESIYRMLCRKMREQSFRVMLYGMSPEEKREFLKVWMKALNETGCEFIALPADGKNTDMLKANAIVLSYRPEGILVLQSPGDLRFAETRLAEIKKSSEIGSFKHIGYIGWERTSRAGREIVYVDYYYTTTRVGRKEYRFFLAIACSSAVGFWGYSPKVFITTTDWNTRMRPGQVLQDWGPKNEGLSRNVTYTLMATAPVTLSCKAPDTVRWADQTSPDTGCVRTLYEIPGAKSGVIYPVMQSSICLLDPSKGHMPVIVDHDFKVELKTFPWSTETLDINFTAVICHPLN